MTRQTESPGPTKASVLEQRVGRLEDQVDALIEAVEVLARGFEDTPMAAERPGAEEERAARRAHELLLLVKGARQQTPGA